jgi:hypothetical protein
VVCTCHEQCPLEKPQHQKGALRTTYAPKTVGRPRRYNLENKLKHTYKKANKQSYNMRLLAIEDKTSFGAVDGDKTEDLPEGDTYQAIQAMVRIWKPKNTTKKHELEAEFNISKLTEVNKPADEWFQHLATKLSLGSRLILVLSVMTIKSCNTFYITSYQKSMNTQLTLSRETSITVL